MEGMNISLTLLASSVESAKSGKNGFVKEVVRASRIAGCMMNFRPKTNGSILADCSKSRGEED